MRTASAPELALLAGVAVQHRPRVKIKDADGVFLDVVTGEGRLGGLCWFYGCDIDVDIDQPVSQAVIRLVRAAGLLSMAPLMTGSMINRNAVGAYAPFLELGRDVRIEVASTAIGVAPVAGDWKNLFEGEIDRISAAQNPIIITCRDKGGRLVDTWTDPGISIDVPDGGIPVPLQTLMQANLDVSVFSPGVTLYVPVSPGFDVTRFVVERGMPVMDVQQKLAQDAIGWDVRYKWRSDLSRWDFTLYEPPRSKTVPDVTINPSQYLTVDEMAIDRTNIRNTIIVKYTESEGAFRGKRAGGTVGAGFAADVPSQNTYGFRPLRIEESSDSPINTAGEAQDLANKVLLDLKDPRADQEIDMYLFWPAELHDLYRFAANGVHYDSAQDLAVVNLRHSLTPTSARTKIQVRGKPAGRYRGWIARANQPYITDTEFAASLNNFHWTESADGNERTFHWDRGGAVEAVWVYDRTRTIPLLTSPWPDASDPPDNVLVVGTDSYTVTKPEDGYGRFLQFTPMFSADVGDVIFESLNWRAVVVGSSAFGSTVTIDESESQATVTVVTSDPGAILLPATPVRFYVTRLGTKTLNAPTSGPGAGLTSGTFTRVETLDPKHPIIIEPLYTYVDGTTELGPSHTFDFDKRANVLNLTAAYANAIATVTAKFDTDTAVGASKAEYQVDGGAWTALTVAADLTASFTVAQTPAGKRTVKVRGKNSAGTAGPDTPIEINQLDNMSGGPNNTFSSLTNVLFSYATEQVDLGWTWNGGGSPDFKVYVKEEPASVFTLAATVTASTYRYTAGHNLDASGSGGDVDIGFYVQALVGGIVLATSAIKTTNYPLGPA